MLKSQATISHLFWLKPKFLRNLWNPSEVYSCSFLSGSIETFINYIVYISGNFSNSYLKQLKTMLSFTVSFLPFWKFCIFFLYILFSCNVEKGNWRIIPAFEKSQGKQEADPILATFTARFELVFVLTKENAFS